MTPQLQKQMLDQATHKDQPQTQPDGAAIQNAKPSADYPDAIAHYPINTSAPRNPSWISARSLTPSIESAIDSFFSSPSNLKSLTPPQVAKHESVRHHITNFTKAIINELPPGEARDKVLEGAFNLFTTMFKAVRTSGV